VVVVVVVRRGVVVVVLRVVVVVVLAVVVVVVVAVVVVVVDAVVAVVDSASDDADALVVTVGPAECEAGGTGSTAPNSDGSRSAPSSDNTPMANNVHARAPTTAPTASRPCPCCRVDSIGVLQVCSSDHW